MAANMLPGKPKSLRSILGSAFLAGEAGEGRGAGRAVEREVSGLAPWALRATSGLPHISAGQQTALHKVLIQPFHRYLLSEA